MMVPQGYPTDFSPHHHLRNLTVLFCTCLLCFQVCVPLCFVSAFPDWWYSIYHYNAQYDIWLITVLNLPVSLVMFVVKRHFLQLCQYLFLLKWFSVCCYLEGFSMALELFPTVHHLWTLVSNCLHLATTILTGTWGCTFRHADPVPTTETSTALVLVIS